MKPLFFAFFVAWPSLAARAEPARAPKYHFVLRGVDEAAGVSSGITAEAQKILEAELARHPEILVGDLPLPGGRTKSYDVNLKILAVSRALNDPPAAKQYRVLERSITLSIFGSTLPEKVMAIGGSGNATIGAEVGKHDDLERKGKDLLLEATTIAVKQAVDMTLTKLSLPPPKTTKAKKK